MLLTTGQAAQELGCAVTTFRRLIHADLLPGLSRRGVRVMVPLSVVQALSARRQAPVHQLESPEVAVLRVDSAQPAADTDRDWIGFAAALGPDHLVKALRGWWRCDAASVAAGGVLPVTLSGYVVAVLTGLERWEKNSEGRHAFPEARLAGYVTDLATPQTVITSGLDGDRRLAELLLGTRLASHSGGAIAYVTTNTATAG
ncbi:MULTISPECIES: helix-turn-helix domain-containing protein [Streptomyces]|uniref:Helix-turn-helix domain-containing protein n=1 Tax=Streptomyces sudanensis TaxID=436397 RepID=A0ABY4TAW1_9ACTN|nr:MULTISPECIES: helix-turn-helix domain-containing protein [Streptomyces]MCP9956125.1 helix-turn-helix domain-containing protein [Streptomyces sudanensis]MCP9985351.1 helix-turn-helix domain-containing protein [Streptomyces sudanensis]MCQ0003239.1 helix-turn-helix domain-containing protein [Streptomyces sudanensis]URN14581.1 helix-turn-helix domain-containing protein [Streptomyces sudanensis]